MSHLGLVLLALVGVLLVTTGLPAFVVLIAASVAGAAAAMLDPQAPSTLLNALPNRIVNLLENDLLQALPLFILMGALLNRMAVVPAIFKTLAWLLPQRLGGRLVSGLVLGALLGPMSGSVGASVMALSQAVEPRLAASGVPAPLRHAAIALASTLGIVVPPSLVLILLGDAMLTAHTIAINATGRADRVINTQDVMRAALVPALLVVAVSLAVGWFAGHRIAASEGSATKSKAPEPPSKGEIGLSIVALVLLLGLLGGVASGYLYAVEAAAGGAVLLFAAGVATGRLGLRSLPPMLTGVMATTGALFAPLLAATTFTLVLRVLGTDKLIEGWITALPGGELTAVCVILGAMALTAFVLDAFEIIFVVVPILIPPLLMRAPDAVWVSTLVLLTLQLSFLIPPAGYALMMTRGVLGPTATSTAVTRALAPFLIGQMLVLAIVVWQPGLVHLLEPERARQRSAPGAPMSNEDVEKRFRDMQKSGSTFGTPSFGTPSLPAPIPPSR